MRVPEQFSFLKACACLLALAGAFPARADTVILDNGKTLEGHVIDNGNSITIEMAQGTVKIAKSRVKSIASKVTPQDEFSRKFAEIQAAVAAHEIEPAAAAERFFVLATWAGEQGLSRGRAEALKRALDLDPEHAGAREACGYVLKDGRWLTKAERNQELGFVLYEGQWVAPEAAREAKQAKQAAQQTQREAQRAEARKQRKKAEAEELAAELADARRERLAEPGPLYYGYNRNSLSPWFWSGTGSPWAQSWPVIPYSYSQWPYVLTPSPSGRTGNAVGPSANTPGPFGPQLRMLRQKAHRPLLRRIPRYSFP